MNSNNVSTAATSLSTVKPSTGSSGESSSSTVTLIDARTFADGHALCDRIDACLAETREAVVVSFDHPTKEMLRKRYECNLYEHARRPNQARIVGRRNDSAPRTQ